MARSSNRARFGSSARKAYQRAAFVASGGGTPPVTPPPAFLGQFNFKATQFTKWRPAAARVKAGTGRVKVVNIGDSNNWGEGQGTGGTNNRTGARSRSQITMAAKRLTALGISSNWEGIWGNGPTTAAGVDISFHRNRFKTG